MGLDSVPARVMCVEDIVPEVNHTFLSDDKLKAQRGSVTTVVQLSVREPEFRLDVSIPCPRPFFLLSSALTDEGGSGPWIRYVCL